MGACRTQSFRSAKASLSESLARARSVTIIIVTVDTEEADIENAGLAGSVRQFHQPFDPDALQSVIRAQMTSV